MSQQEEKLALQQKQGLNDRKNKANLLKQTKTDISAKEKSINDLIAKLNISIKDCSAAQASVDLAKTNVDSMHHRNKMYNEMTNSLT